MRSLLDECLPARRRVAFPGHAVLTVAQARWQGVGDGLLLKQAEASFDVFVTVDRQMQYQQQLERFKMGFVLILVSNNRFETFRPLFPDLRRAVKQVTTGQLVTVAAKADA